MIHFKPEKKNKIKLLMLFINRLGKYQETQGFNTSSRSEVILKSYSIFLKIIERGDHA